MKHAKRRSVALGLVSALMGCKTLPIQAPASRPSAAQAASFGSVLIRVHWPERPQAIPLSANTLIVQAYDALGRNAGSVSLERGTGSDFQVSSLRLPAGTYTVEARAYRETSPTPASVPTALGSAGNVVIKTDLETDLAMTLVAQAPTFGGLSALAGGIGSQILLDSVRFFGRSAVPSDTVRVAFGYDDHTRVSAPSFFQSRWFTDPVMGLNHLLDPALDKLVVTVPSGITGLAKVFLSVDGVEVFVNTFQVVDRMTLVPSAITLQVGDAYAATSGLSAFSLGSQSALVYPMLSWISSDPSIAFVTALGTIYAYRPGQVIVTAWSGVVSASFTLNVTQRGSTASLAVNVPVLKSGNVTTPIALPVYTGNASGIVTP